MENDLPDPVRDFRLNAQLVGRGRVQHSYDDPDAPPSSPPRVEIWKSEKRPIGGGGQGQVYLQNCIRGSRLYTQRAVKIIPIQEGGGRRRYIRELETSTKFSHQQYSRYFVRLLGWYESDDSLCIAMEYYPDGDLQTYLSKINRLSENDSRYIVSQVLKGLEIMHRQGFTHGDVKPKNILIKRFPTDEGPHTWWIKLADFGISKRMKEASGATTVVGTKEYMAPELLLHGNSPDVNFPAADMWALGAMSFRMLTQSPVFSELVEAVQYLRSPKRFAPARQLENCNVSTDGRAFTCALLQLEPDKRLDAKAALLHAWVRPCMPTAPVTIRSQAPSSAISSSSYSRRSSFDKERGMTTQVSSTQMDSDIKPATILKDDSKTPSQQGHDIHLRRKVTAQQRDEKAEDRFFHHRSVPDRSYGKASSISESPKAPRDHVPNLHGNDSNKEVETQLWHAIRYGYGQKPLLCAAANGDEIIAKLLLEKGADVEVKGRFLMTPLLWAAANGREATAKLLLENGADIESKDEYLSTPLSEAARGGHETLAKLLLENGADMEAKDTFGTTPLSHAAKSGHKALVRLLLEKGADTESKSTSAKTPLLYAARDGHEPVVKMLFEKGAIKEPRNKDGRTPLSYAADRGHKALVRLFLENGADVESKDTLDMTPLLYAASNGHKTVIEMLLKKGADLEAKDVEGRTPLALAKLRAHGSTVELLLREGADRESRDIYGQAALPKQKRTKVRFQRSTRLGF